MHICETLSSYFIDSTHYWFRIKLFFVGIYFNICCANDGGVLGFCLYHFDLSEQALSILSASWAHFVHVNLVQSGICHGTFLISETEFCGRIQN